MATRWVAFIFTCPTPLRCGTRTPQHEARPSNEGRPNSYINKKAPLTYLKTPL